MIKHSIRLPGMWPFSVSQSGASHWQQDGTHHGAASRPMIATARFVRLGEPRAAWDFTRHGDPELEGWRLWLYFRGGYAWCLDVLIDRRDAA